MATMHLVKQTKITNRSTMDDLLQLIFVVSLLLPFTVSAEPVTVSGHYFSNAALESEVFTPCNSKETWWMTVNDPSLAKELASRYAQACGSDNRKFCQGVFLKVIGERTKLGSYGHLGHYQRELFVKKILALRATVDEQTDCNADAQTDGKGRVAK